MSDEPDRDLPMVEAGRYAKLAAARERGLVVAAQGLPYEIKREARAWVLLVGEESMEAVRRELAAFESEERERPAARTLLPGGKFATFPIFLGGWVLATFFLVQQLAGKRWLEQGSAEGQAILHGE